MKTEEIRKLIEAATPDFAEAMDHNSFEGWGLNVAHPNVRFYDASRDLLPKLLKVAEAASNPDLRCPGDPYTGRGLDEFDSAIAKLDQALAALEAE